MRGINEIGLSQLWAHMGRICITLSNLIILNILSTLITQNIPITQN